MSRPELVVFDLAGTTIQENGTVIKSLVDSFTKNGYPISGEAVQRWRGLRKRDAIRILLEENHPDLSADKNELINQIHDGFTLNMLESYEINANTIAAPHALEVFEWLRSNHIQVALNTGFTRLITNVLLNKLGWRTGKMIDQVISSDEVPLGRPHLDMILALMKKLGIRNSKAVVKIGDTIADVQEGRNAGCGIVIAITTGSESRESLEKYLPDYVINDLIEIKALINTIL
jgi:phosphonatase-like hydrolase